METLKRNEWPGALLVTLGLAGLVALGFLPASASIFRSLARVLGAFPAGLGDTADRMAFPLLALIFWKSLPARRGGPVQPPPVLAPLARSAAAPLGIALVWGAFRPGPSFAQLLSLPGGRDTLLWYLVLAPLGEEWLFRGWFYNLFDRRWAGRLASLTNPLPAAVWLSSGAFAVWHLQNRAIASPGAVLFQVVYTFWTGVWLGYLRWKTGGVSAGVLAHVCLNTAASLL